MRWVFVCLLGAAAATGGCDATRDAAQRTGETLNEKLAPVGEKAGETSNKLGEASIKLQIKSKFADDADIKSSQIHIDVKDGVVTLTGSQPTFEGRRHAVDAAQSVKGVTKVDSKLTIDPPKGGD